jgi:chemotaxis protein methyltransferase CheR
MSQALAILPPAAREVRPLADGEFGLIQKLVFREAGIYLSEAKRALVAARLLRRLRDLGLATYGAYYLRAVDDQNELRLLLDAITTNETHFFREPRHFELLQSVLIPEWRREAATGQRPRTIRLWSAGCSTGEEPYSLAMMLLSSLPAEEAWDVRVLATDLSTRALDAASEGIFSAEKAAAIPKPLLQRFMLKGVGNQEGNVKVSPALRELVTFRRINLNHEDYTVDGPFDAILCRNVFIYFKHSTRDQIVYRLMEYLRPSGCFFVGHSESLVGVPGLETVIPTVYRRRSPAREDRSGRRPTREDDR